jgi:hypothetical protein
MPSSSVTQSVSPRQKEGQDIGLIEEIHRVKQILQEINSEVSDLKASTKNKLLGQTQQNKQD